ncbi:MULTISPECIES: DUF3764 family protein [Prochlorococcus]|uniref:DUF3764 family protein n=1 Tax=Prochlorococcus TaxID=1218 RepID=UPI000533AD76|nr:MULTISPECIES: DUF3764 family protein [Prochlorococcus]KGG14179.1 hypothetical protein EV05_0069 [Prochlorococcus sp. MIT 0601]
MTLETTVVTFKLNGTFREWSAIFDSDEANRRHAEYGIKPLYRGVNKEDPQKVIVIHQHHEGGLDKFLAANGEWISTHDVEMTSLEQSTWIVD